MDDNTLVDAKSAFGRLVEGNRRFVANVRSSEALVSQVKREQLVERQRPFAIVLGCSDSRVPAELVFDQGLGDLFVIRVAGNIVAPSLVGSVEFAAARFGSRLVVVLGHTFCGAIDATLEAIERPDSVSSRNVQAIVDRVRPAVEPLMSTGLANDRAALSREAVRANIRASANHLRHASQILEDLIARQGVHVVGAEYRLDSGEVEFFDGVPTGWR